MPKLNEGSLEGKITSWDKDKAIGIISLGDSKEPTPGKNELFFGEADLAEGTHVLDLAEGTRVSLNSVLGENGPRASAVSKLNDVSLADLRSNRQEHREVSSGPFPGNIQKLREDGTGYIRLNSGKDLFFHAKDLNGTAFHELREGDEVLVGNIEEMRSSTNTRRAANITLPTASLPSVTHLDEGTAAALAKHKGTLDIASLSCVERLASSKPVLEKVLADAIIEEGRVMEKKEALKYLVLSATADGINLDSLILTEVFTDKDGAILKLEAKSTDEKTGDYKILTYQIKSTRGDQSADETNVDVSSWEKGSEYPHSADSLAKYVGGKWLLLDNSKPKGEKWIAQK